MSDNIKPFPIQGALGFAFYPDREQPCTIPWWLAEIAYEHYSKLYGSRQTLERLAERGGFGRKELVSLLRQKPHQGI